MAELSASVLTFRNNSQNDVLNAFLEQGDLFARTGRLDQAFTAFSNAFRVGVVSKERITSLVDAFVEFQRNKLCRERKDEPSNSVDSNSSVLTCSICSCVFMKPVTLACGHTFCEVCHCEEKLFTGSAECRKCGKMVPEADGTVHSVNVLIMNAIQKWLPYEYQKQERKLQGHIYLVENAVKSAIDCFNGVLSTSANDLHCLCWRSDAFLRLGQLDLALRDIEQACKLRPSLARIFHRKAVILANFARLEGILSSRYEESVLALLRCCSLAPTCERYRQEFTDSLHQLLSPKFTNLSRTLSVLKQGRGRGNELASESTQILSPQACSQLANEKRQSASHYCTKNRDNAFTASVENHKSKLKFGGKGDKKRTSTQTRTDGSHLGGQPDSVSLDKDILHLRETEDFECKLCYNLLFQPVTTICGHTFCRECLQRCLDHRLECPCCRTTLDQYHRGTRKMDITQELETILVKYFPADYNERRSKFEEKMNAFKILRDDQNPQVPIFVCTLVVPKVQCPLHIFEPRYRLMLRRCLESGSKQFGMCLASEDPNKNFVDYGTMLNVQAVNYLPDGRSIVHTVGGRRFHVISRSMVDGYHTATVEWVQDERVDDVEELKQLIELNRVGHITLQTWFSGMTAEQRQCITNAVGPVPAFDENLQLVNDGPDWVWWALAALPLQDTPKLAILGMTSMLTRLQNVIRFLQMMMSLQKNLTNTRPSAS